MSLASEKDSLNNTEKNINQKGNRYTLNATKSHHYCGRKRCQRTDSGSSTFTLFTHNFVFWLVFVHYLG